MDSQDILEDIAGVVSKGMTDRGMSPEKLAKASGVDLAELDHMTLERCDNLFSVMKVLTALDCELIVIPKEE